MEINYKSLTEIFYSSIIPMLSLPYDFYLLLQRCYFSYLLFTTNIITNTAIAIATATPLKGTGQGKGKGKGKEPREIFLLMGEGPRGSRGRSRPWTCASRLHCASLRSPQPARPRGCEGPPRRLCERLSASGPSFSARGSLVAVVAAD